MPTNSNWASLARQVLSIIGPLMIAKGVTDPAGWNQFSNLLIELIGVALPIGSAIWSRIENAKGTREKVAALNMTPPVIPATLTTITAQAPAIAKEAAKVTS